MKRHHDIIDSPLGPIALVAEDGELCGVYFEACRYEPSPAQLGPRRRGGLRAVAEQLDEYFIGERTEFDVALQPRGTPFQLDVWAALREIPFGRTETYGALARRIGRPGAARAVGTANARNPISLIIPCHRVIGADGGLTGYGGGMRRKQALLDLERARVGA